MKRRTLYENGIETVLFMSPCFPGITDFKEIIEASFKFIDEYRFENLNLRGDYRQRILAYIHEKYPHLDDLYQTIYGKSAGVISRKSKSSSETIPRIV